MLRTRFSGTTLLIVAHRLQTVMDCDFVLVMQNGKAVEFGSPRELLLSAEKENQEEVGETDGFLYTFASLVDATGPGSSAALRAIAFAKE